MIKKICARCQKEFIEITKLYCETCVKEVAEYRKQNHSKNRDYNHDSFYSKKTWQRVRNQVLMEEPVCRICNRNPSKVCDHIIPRKKGGADYERSNLQGLCVSCHARKSFLESL